MKDSCLGPLSAFSGGLCRQPTASPTAAQKLAKSTWRRWPKPLQRDWTTGHGCTMPSWLARQMKPLMCTVVLGPLLILAGCATSDERSALTAEALICANPNVEAEKGGVENCLDFYAGLRHSNNRDVCANRTLYDCIQLLRSLEQEDVRRMREGQTRSQDVDKLLCSTLVNDLAVTTLPASCPAAGAAKQIASHGAFVVR